MSTKKISGLDNIRLFAPGDYEALAGLTLALYPDHADSAEEIRFSDEHRDPKVHWKRYVWIEDGRVVAQGGYSQNAWAFHPQRFWIDVEVHPDFQGRGIGSTFYRFLEDEVMRHEPIKLQAATGDLHPRGIAFAERRGFKREQTERESRLDLARFDPAAWSEARDSVREQGIVIRSYAALSAERDIQRELYELVTTLNLDVPWPDPPTPPEFELWSTRMLENPNLLPEGYHIALDGDRLVGMSNLWNAQAVDDVHIFQQQGQLQGFITQNYIAHSGVAHVNRSIGGATVLVGKVKHGHRAALHYLIGIAGAVSVNALLGKSIFHRAPGLFTLGGQMGIDLFLVGHKVSHNRLGRQQRSMMSRISSAGEFHHKIPVAPGQVHNIRPSGDGSHRHPAANRFAKGSQIGLHSI